MNFINSNINKVIQGDCLKVMDNIPAHSIDMVLCDLPYGTTHNSWDKVIDLSELWKHYRRIVKPAGVIALTAQGVFTGQLIMSNADMFRYKIAWIKSRATNFLNAQRQPLRKHEDICIFYKGKAAFHPQMTDGKPYNRGMRTGLTENYNSFKPAKICSGSGKRYPCDILFYEEQTVVDNIYCKTAETEGKPWHANQKPVELGRYLIRAYSNPGDIILDNTCGSGSFLVAAMLEGRNFIGIEKNEPQFRLKERTVDYIGVCNVRLHAASQEMRS